MTPTIKHLFSYGTSKLKEIVGLGSEKGMSIVLETTTRCNRSCLYCPRDIIPWVRDLGDIKPEIADLIVERLAEFDRIFNVNFVGFGEPLLYNKIFNLIDALRSIVKGKIILTTNGVLLNDKTTNQILTSKLDELDISLNIPTKPLHDTYHHNGTYDLVRENIINFLKKKGDRKPKTLIRIMKFKETLPHIERERVFWERHLNENDFFSVTLLMNWAGYVDVESWGVEFGSPIQPICKHVVSNALMISKEGNVFACCLGTIFPPDHPSCLGNLVNYSLKELLEIKKTKIPKVFPECDICSEYRHYIDFETGEHIKRMVKVKDYAEN